MRKNITTTTAVGLGTVVSAVTSLVAGWTAYSRLLIDHHLPLPPALDAEQRRFAGTNTALLNYYVEQTAEGRPLVLLHSINAAGSAYEMKPIFEHYRHSRPVYALDLPGFGFSARDDQAYSPEIYKNAIIALLADQIKERADVVALSLSSEFAAMAARERPDLFHSLTMISPSGLEANKSPSENENGAYNFVAFPLWSQALYDLLATRLSIHYYLQKSFYGEVDQGLKDYAYLTAHQPGARHAPFYFISGKLFTPTIREEVYTRLTVPVLVLYDRDPFVRFDMLGEMLDQYPNWRATRIMPTRGLPHFEKMPETAQALNRFWQQISSQSN